MESVRTGANGAGAAMNFAIVARLALAALFAWLCAPARAMTGEAPEFRALAENVFVYVGKRNEANAMAIVTGQGVVVVDTGNSPAETRNFAKAIRAATSLPVQYVIVTQNHGDHIGGAPFFAPPATMIVHDKVAKALAEMKPWRIKAWRARFPERAGALESSAPLSSVISFPNRMSLRLGGVAMELFHVRDEYNDGDVAVWLPGLGILHAGFVGYKDRHPDIRPDYSHGTTAGMLKQLEAMIALKPKIVIPVHGPVSTADDLKVEVDYILSARAKVRAMMDRGLGIDAIRAGFDMREYAGWDLPDHFPLIAETIWREFRGEGPQRDAVAELPISGTIRAIAELGRFLTVVTDAGDELKLRISNETFVEGVADRALLKPGAKFSATYQKPEGVTPALGYLLMEVSFAP